MLFNKKREKKELRTGTIVLLESTLHNLGRKKKNIL